MLYIGVSLDWLKRSNFSQPSRRRMPSYEVVRSQNELWIFARQWLLLGTCGSQYADGSEPPRVLWRPVGLSQAATVVA